MKSIMQSLPRKKLSEEEAKRMLNEILEEDEQANMDDENEDDDGSEFCSAACSEKDPVIQKKFCECMHIAENSSRFSLRVMEAMRSLQRDEDDLLPASSVEDIVDYIQTNYRDDGDLYAQVRTALKQVCSQGFAMELLENEYYLIGPDAVSMNRITCSNDRKDCLLSSSAKTPKYYKKDDPKDDDCLCEATRSTEEPRLANKRRRISKDKVAKGVRQSRVSDFARNLQAKRRQNERDEDISTEEASECTCDLTATDEGLNEHRDAIRETVRIAPNMQRKLHHAQESGDRRINEKKQRRLAELPMDISRRETNDQGKRRTRRNGDAMVTSDMMKDRATKNAEKIDEDNFEVNETTPDSVEDRVELQDRVALKRAKQHEREVKRWIKRCKEECERQKNRRLAEK